MVVLGGRASWMGLVTYKREPREHPGPSTMGGHGEKVPSMNQETGPHIDTKSAMP